MIITCYFGLHILPQKSRQQEAIRLGRKDRYHKQHISNFDNWINYHSSTQYTGWNTSEGRLSKPMNRMYPRDVLERCHKNRLSSDTSLSPTEEQRFFSNSTLPSITITEFDMQNEQLNCMPDLQLFTCTVICYCIYLQIII